MESGEELSGSGGGYLQLCGTPTLIAGLVFARDVLLANVFFRAVVQYGAPTPFVKHNLSLLLGSFLLYSNVGFAFLWTAGLTVGSYTLLMILTLVAKKRRGLITSIMVIVFLLQSEYLVVNSKMWQQIRGIQMIAAMKIISVAVDLDNGYMQDAPSPAAFAGYIMCPANCILGPWVSFRKYEQSLGKKYLNRSWIFAVVLNVVIALIALFLSNCFIPWYISDENSKWIIAYRDAQSFRASHYFISIMSQAFMISGCFGDQTDSSWSVAVTDPYHIEIPRSLVQVVIYWNIPMHQWLKMYVFKVCKPYGKFFAIFATYSISSLLHGLNFQLSVALLSIGMFSYVEYKMRTKLSSIFSACCLVSACSKNCTHTYRKSNAIVMFVNVMFSCLAVFHLAYLGVMFEASFAIQETGYSYAHTLKKWSDLNFASHTIATITHLVYCII
ncbi:protein-serine O-palmitoleoyltransferase por [Arctopsyche grandis]|uniref:protein-serine O-palmitoleoyltransferase por n=1 Tax=Arctopsyche grandis TaxID=121162 RepID=UPI00406D8394